MLLKMTASELENMIEHSSAYCWKCQSIFSHWDPAIMKGECPNCGNKQVWGFQALIDSNQIEVREPEKPPEHLNKTETLTEELEKKWFNKPK